ncbi:MAG TPA: ribosome maturation factor RimM [Candidatus Dormibacteraeota bacterium]|nr:ribosome maturation factor RimM [Candidatus Dormibacteraeota bacterium]
MVRVGQVLGAFGIRGAVKVLALTDFAERFAPGSELRLDGVNRRVEWSRDQPAGLVVKFAGVEGRTAAELLRGHYLEVGDEDLLPLPEGRWYHHDLVGLAVATERGRELGTLTDVVTRPANDVWVVQGGAGEHLVPATRDAVVRVDLGAGRVTVADWLLDVEEA